MSQTGRGQAPRRIVGALAATAIALLGAVAVSSPAMAAPSFGNIDQGAEGSIIVHKHEHQVGDAPVTQGTRRQRSGDPNPWHRGR